MPVTRGAAIAACARSASINLQGRDKQRRAVGRQVELKQLDRGEPVLVRIVGAEDRSQRASANLVEHAKRTERVWRRGAGRFRVQRGTPQGRQLNRNIETSRVQWVTAGFQLAC